MGRKILSETTTTTHTTTNIDGTTSEEVTSRERNLALVDNEPEFIKIYIETICFVKAIPTAHTAILLALLERMSYADERYPMTIIVNGFVKDSIARETGKSVKTVERAITDFLKHNMLFRIGGERSGAYQANAEMFGKGKWKDLSKLRKEQFEKFNAKIDFLKGTVTAEIEPKPTKEEPIGDIVGKDSVKTGTDD